MSTLAQPDPSALAAQLLYAYARAVDSGDLDALTELAHPDVAITRSGQTAHGREEFLAVYRGFARSGVRASRHLITNVQAFPQSDGTLLARAYFTAIMLEGEGSRFVVGQYADTLRDDGAGLRFAHKRIIADGFVPAQPAQGWVGVTAEPVVAP